MISNNLKRFGATKGWYRTDSSIFGIHNNYLFNIHQSIGQPKIIVCQTQAMSPTQVSELSESLAEQKKALKYALFEVEIDYISLTFTESILPTKHEKLNETFDFLSVTLSNKNIKSKFDCSGKLNYYNWSGEGVLLSESDFINKTTEMELTYQSENRSYLNGFFGALLFALPMIIIWVLCVVYLERASTAFGVLVTMLGSGGYEKFKGKLGFWSKWLIALASIIVILLANLAILAVSLSNDGVPVEHMVGIFKMDPAAQSYFKSNLFLSSMFAVLSWFWLFFDTSTKKGFIQPAQQL